MMDSPEISPVEATIEQRIEERLRSGRYRSAQDVMRAALGALDREEQAHDDMLRRKVADAMADPRPSIAAADVFAELKARHAERAKSAPHGA